MNQDMQRQHHASRYHRARNRRRRLETHIDDLSDTSSDSSFDDYSTQEMAQLQLYQTKLINETTEQKIQVIVAAIAFSPTDSAHVSAAHIVNDQQNLQQIDLSLDVKKDIQSQLSGQKEVDQQLQQWFEHKKAFPGCTSFRFETTYRRNKHGIKLIRFKFNWAELLARWEKKYNFNNNKQASAQLLDEMGSSFIEMIHQFQTVFEVLTRAYEALSRQYAQQSQFLDYGYFRQYVQIWRRSVSHHLRRERRERRDLLQEGFNTPHIPADQFRELKIAADYVQGLKAAKIANGHDARQIELFNIRRQLEGSLQNFHSLHFSIQLKMQLKMEKKLAKSILQVKSQMYQSELVKFWGMKSLQDFRHFMQNLFGWLYDFRPPDYRLYVQDIRQFVKKISFTIDSFKYKIPPQQMIG